MRLLIEHQSGPSPLPKIWLTTGQSVTVGRTAEADYCAERDRFMSSIHFRVECRDASCWIRDLGSTNGTYVNDDKVIESALKDGDLLRAGETVFRVQLEASSSDSGASASGQLALGTSSRSATPTVDYSPGMAAAWPSSLAFEVGPAGSRADDAGAPGGAPPTTGAVPSGREPSPLTRTMPIVSLPTHRIELLCLEVRSGQPPQKTWLPPGKSITVGRHSSTDFCVPHDPTVSGTHFRLSCDYHECRIRDLESTAGTLVNGRRIRDAVLRHGNVITAGRTEFVVEIRHERTEGPAGPSTPSFVAVPSPSGIFSYQGCDPQLSWQDMLRLMSQRLPLYLVVHFSGLHVPRPANPVYLLDWLPPAVAARMSPLVLPVARLADVQPVLEAGWRHDALACVFSQLELAPLLRRLRLAARGQSYAADIPDSEHMLGGTRPSQLARVLATGEPAFVGSVFAGVDAVLIEPQASPLWEILGDESLADVLESLGLSPHSPSLAG